jgi:hypothetical protein
MQNQSITRKQPTDVVLQQGANGAVVQHALSQLEQLRRVARIAQAEADLTYVQLQAYLALEGRDEYLQQWLQDTSAYLLAGYQRAHNVVVHMAWEDIIKNRPEAIVRTVYVEPPSKSLLHRLTGR